MLVPQGDPNGGEELEKVNRKEAGAPYRYAESPFLDLAAARRMTGAPRGAPEGLARQALGDDGTPRRAHTCRRINGTKADIRGGMAIASSSKRAVRTAADSSGLRRNDRGERMTKKWKLKRGFVRAHVQMDVDARRVLALKVTDEKTGGAPVFETPVTEAVAAPDGAAARGEARGKEAQAEAEGEKEEAAAAAAAEAARPASEEAAAARAVAADDGGTAREREPEASVPAAAAAAAAEGAEKATCADGAHASRKNVATCRELGIVPFIKTGKNAATAGKGGGDGRGGAVRERPGFGTKCVSDLAAAEKAAGTGARKAAGRCGRRRAAEVVFSAVKRLFGSGARAPEWKNIVREVGPKVAPYNRLVGMASGGIGWGDSGGGRGEGRGEERSTGAVRDSYEINYMTRLCTLPRLKMTPVSCRAWRQNGRDLPGERIGSRGAGGRQAAPRSGRSRCPSGASRRPRDRSPRAGTGSAGRRSRIQSPPGRWNSRCAGRAPSRPQPAAPPFFVAPPAAPRPAAPRKSRSGSRAAPPLAAAAKPASAGRAGRGLTRGGPICRVCRGRRGPAPRICTRDVPDRGARKARRAAGGGEVSVHGRRAPACGQQPPPLRRESGSAEAFSRP